MTAPHQTPLPPGEDRAVELPDGRRLGVREHGNPEGPPVLYFHGFPGSRLEPGFFPHPHVRIFAVERPGYGLSDPQKGRGLGDWGEDIARLADALGLDRFAVLGVSGGGPYAMAAAHALGERLTATLLICPLGPPQAPGMSEAPVRTLLSVGRQRMVSAAASALAARLIRSRRMEQRFAAMRQRLSERRAAGAPKEAAARTPEFMQFLLENWRAGVARGGAGMAGDARIYAGDWPFDLADIKTPVHLWHGTHDRVVPVGVGAYYAKHLPAIKAHFSEGDGHFSIISASLRAVEDVILSAAP